MAEQISRRLGEGETIEQLAEIYGMSVKRVQRISLDRGFNFDERKKVMK
jgi:hypothetical protein